MMLMAQLMPDAGKTAQLSIEDGNTRKASPLEAFYDRFSQNEYFKQLRNQIYGPAP
jgi:hypothetical protein